jgi:hypothetical protein
LVEAVRTAVSRFRAEYETLLGRRSWIFHFLKAEGIYQLHEAVSRVDRATSEAAHKWGYSKLALELAFFFGDQLLNLITPTIREAYLLHSTFLVEVGLPRPEDIQVRFQSFLTEKTRYGTVYFSPVRQTLEIDGVEGVLAYSTHALRRRLERMAGPEQTYWAMRVAFDGVYDHGHVEAWHNEKGEPGFGVFVTLGGSLANEVIEKVAEESGADRRCLLRSGYCPRVIARRWVVCYDWAVAISVAC